MKYFKVEVTLGHLGKKKGVSTWIYVEHETMIKAIDFARSLPGVKHDRLPTLAVEITKEEFLEGRQQDRYKNRMDSISVD